MSKEFHINTKFIYIIYIYFRNCFFDFSLPSINPYHRQNSKKYIREDIEVN